MNASECMEAGWIDSAHGRVFACYHPASGELDRACAVLLCDPFGAQRMNLHLTYRALALRLAEAGFPVLRVDYPGTGDSSGYPRGPGQVSVWLASLHAAADFLRARSGKSELCVFGALLGGTLAGALAAARADVTGLALWGAFPSGRAFLRELTAFRGATPANPSGLRPSDWQEGDQEAVGFLITRATADELAALDFLQLAAPIARVAAVFRRNRAIAVEPVAEHLRRAGTEVYLQASAVGDIAEIEDDHAQPPCALLDEMLRWWTATYPASSNHAREAPARPALEPRVSLNNRRGEAVEETVVRFGDDAQIFGIVSHTSTGQRQGRPAVVLVNGGATHRAGINRNYTEWARELAARGLIVLRMDLRGLGDSPPLRPEDLGVLRRDESRRDIRDAIGFLQQRYAATSIACVGLCLGGYQAFHTALEDPRVSGLVMLNPLRFRSAGQGPSKELAYLSLAQYARAALAPETWVRLISGDVDAGGVSRSIAARVAKQVLARARIAGSRLGVGRTPPASWIADKFIELTERGCNALVVFSAGDGIAELFEEEIALDRARLQATGRLSIEVMHDTDHVFTPLFSQQRAGEILERTLLRWTSGSD